MNLFQQKCAKCGKDFPGGSNFCPYCGEPAKGGKVKCGNCGTENDATANFCRRCGQDLARAQMPMVVDNCWQRGADDFATRIDVRDLRGVLATDLTVEPGTRALLIADGKNIGVVDPGRYTVQTLVDRIPVLNTLLDSTKTFSAILTDVGSADLPFELTGLYTKDPLKISMKCELVLQMHDPLLFITNLMKGQRSFPLRSLRGYLFDEVVDAAQECIGKRSVDELSRNLQLKREMEVEMEAHLSRTLELAGMRLVQLRTLDYELGRYDKVRGVNEEYFLQISEEEAKNQGRKRVFDITKETWLQELAEDTAKAEIHEQRAAAWERMRRTVMAEQMNEIRSKDDFDVFMEDVDKKKLLRAEERENLKRDILERREDQDKLRAHLAAKADMERDYELKTADLSLQRDLTGSQIRFELDTERQRLEGRVGLDTLRWESEIKRQRAESEFRREQGKLDDAERQVREIGNAKAANEIRISNAKTEAEIRAAEREQDRLDGEMGLALLNQMQTQKLALQHQERMNQLEQQKLHLDLQLQELRARTELTMQEKRAAHEQELQRLQVIGQMSSEALISVSGAEQGRILAELKRTETLKGMTEEQILAMAAEHSPQVAQAFIEKFKAMQSPELQKQLQQMYDKMLEEQKLSAKSLQETQESNARRLQEMFNKALDSQRDTATAFSRTTPTQPLVVVTPGGTQPTPITADGHSQVAGQVQICKKCRKPSVIGVKFCDNCGEAFY